MEKKFQVTLFCSTGQYKPVASIITRKDVAEGKDLLKDAQSKKEIVHDGVIKICQKRYWTKKDLVKYHYTKAKVRALD